MKKSRTLISTPRSYGKMHSMCVDIIDSHFRGHDIQIHPSLEHKEKCTKVDVAIEAFELLKRGYAMEKQQYNSMLLIEKTLVKLKEN